MAYVITDETGRVVTTVPSSVAAHRATRRAGNVGAVASKVRVCAACKSPDGPGELELRPYGKRSALICYRCANKSPKSRALAKRTFGKKIDAAGPLILTRDGPKPLAGG